MICPGWTSHPSQDWNPVRPARGRLSAPCLFSFQAMGRIFVGLCQVGAWGCFDEFNRLEERMLSAVSQQVQCIQEALREHSNPNSEKSELVFLLSYPAAG